MAKIRVYKFEPSGCSPCFFDSKEAVIEELKSFLDEAIPEDDFTISVEEVEESEYAKAPEHEGY